MRPLILLGALVAGANLGAAQTPSPALGVVIKEGNAVNSIDRAAKSIIGKVQAGEGPHEVEASADGMAWAGPR